MIASFALLGLGCDGEPDPIDAGSADAGPSVEAGTLDAGALDAGTAECPEASLAACTYAPRSHPVDSVEGYVVESAAFGTTHPILVRYPSDLTSRRRS